MSQLPKHRAYTHDNADRIARVQYSDGTHEVDYTYDPNGHVTSRVDAAGTTTYTFDDLGHLLSTGNTANGNTVTSTYDLAGALATSADALGTTTYSYDPAHQLTQMSYRKAATSITPSSRTTPTANAPTCGCNRTPVTPCGPRTNTSPTTPPGA